MYITINVIMRCFANTSTTCISKVSKHINWLIIDAAHHVSSIVYQHAVYS